MSIEGKKKALLNHALNVANTTLKLEAEAIKHYGYSFVDMMMREAAKATAIYFYCRECGSDINQVSRVNYKKWCNDCAIKKKMDAKNSYVRINRAKGLMPLGNDRSRAKYYGVDYEPIKRNIVFDKADWCCESCGISTPMSEKGKNNDNSPELDHIIPISKGGPHKYDNVQLLCRACNAIKSDRYDSALA
jgi:hypothetical protein